MCGKKLINIWLAFRIWTWN